MIKIILKIKLFFLFSLIFVVGSSSAYPIHYIPVDDEYYQWYRWLQFDTEFHAQHPFSTHYRLFQNQKLLSDSSGQVSPELLWASRLLTETRSDCSSDMMGVLSLRNQTVTVQHTGLSDSLTDRLKAAFSLEYRLTTRLSFFSRFYADTRGLHDSRYPGHRWGASNSDLAGMNDITVLIYRHPRWGDLTLGKQPLYWGHPTSGALMLSDNAPPMTMIHYQKQSRRFIFTYFTAQLNDIFTQPNNDYYKERINRYLSAHRLDFQLTPAVQIALSEMVLYGGQSRKLEWYYLNPFSIYFLEQFTAALPFTSESSEDDNLFLDLEFFWKVHPRWNLYLDWFIDDFQYDMVSEPNEISFTVGSEYMMNHGWLHGYWSMEYTRINNWVYGQNKVWNRYLHYHSIIGHYMGPDGHQLQTRFQSVLGRHWMAALAGAWQAKGEGSVYDDRGSVVPDTQFPSGIVTSRYRMELSLTWRPSLSKQVRTSFGWEHAKNLNHQAGDRDTGLSFQLELIWQQPVTPLLHSLIDQLR